MNKCISCNKESINIPAVLPLCRSCIIEKFNEHESLIYSIHKKTREKYKLEEAVPKNNGGVVCRICGNNCQIQINDKGFCGLRTNEDGKLKHVKGSENEGILSYYFDALPTNCVASWVCAASKEKDKDWELYSYSKKYEYGYNNLAVFYETCSFNCLFCQNYTFRLTSANKESISARDLAKAVQDDTACICYFGGDPGTQILHSIKTSEIALKKNNRILRICWETNGNIEPSHLKKMAEICHNSHGCIKFDIKTFSEELNIALCGISNKRTFENFRKLAEMRKLRVMPPMLIASTLLIPGYINEEEVYNIAKFIADIDPSIPYSLLAFYPTFFFSDMPPTGKEQAHACFNAAKKAGLKNINIANKHILEMS